MKKFLRALKDFANYYQEKTPWGSTLIGFLFSFFCTICITLAVIGIEQLNSCWEQFQCTTDNLVPTATACLFSICFQAFYIQYKELLDEYTQADYLPLGIFTYLISYLIIKFLVDRCIISSEFFIALFLVMTIMILTYAVVICWEIHKMFQQRYSAVGDIRLISDGHDGGGSGSPAAEVQELATTGKEGGI